MGSRTRRILQLPTSASNHDKTGKLINLKTPYYGVGAIFFFRLCYDKIKKIGIINLTSRTIIITTGASLFYDILSIS